MTLPTPSIIEKLREDTAAEAERLEAELARVRQVERILWTNPKDPKDAAYITARATVEPELTANEKRLLSYVADHPDTTIRQFADASSTVPTSAYRVAQKLMDKKLITITSQPGDTQTFREVNPS